MKIRLLSCGLLLPLVLALAACQGHNDTDTVQPGTGAAVPHTTPPPANPTMPANTMPPPNSTTMPPPGGSMPPATPAPTSTAAH